MSNSARLLLFQYLLPVVYAVLLYFIQILPKDGSLLTVILFLLGFYIGNAVMWIDGVFLYPYYNELRTEPKQLITRSVLFILAYIPVALFVHTSSASVLGSGLVFAIGSTLASEAYILKNDPLSFQYHFLFQLKRTLSQAEVTQVVWAFIAFMGITSIVFLF